MSVPTVKKLLGDAGAGLDQSHGTSTLYEVMNAMANGLSEMLTDYLATIATGLLSGMVVNYACKLTNLRTAVGTTGTAGATTCQVLVNGVSAGELTTDNTDADGLAKSLAMDVDLVAGDTVQFNVSAAPTAGADLIATARLMPVSAE